VYYSLVLSRPRDVLAIETVWGYADDWRTNSSVSRGVQSEPVLLDSGEDVRRCAAWLFAVNWVIAGLALVTLRSWSLLDRLDTAWALAGAWVAMFLAVALVGWASLGHRGALLVGGSFPLTLCGLLLLAQSPASSGRTPLMVVLMLGSLPVAGILGGVFVRPRPTLAASACIGIPLWLGSTCFMWSEAVRTIWGRDTDPLNSMFMTILLPLFALLATLAVWLASMVGWTLGHLVGKQEGTGESHTLLEQRHDAGG